MRAVLTLLFLPWRRSFVLCTCALLVTALGLWLGVIAHGSARGRSGLTTLLLSTVGFGSGIWHVACGMALASVCRAESFLMPRFRDGLVIGAVLDVLLTVLAPAILIAVLGGDAIFAASTLLAGGALGLSIGMGSRIGLWIWLAAVASSFAPAYARALLEALRQSRLTPLLLALGALVRLRAVLAPLFRNEDRGAFVSPLEVQANDRRPGMDALSHQRPLKGFAGWIKGGYDRLAEWRLRRVLARGDAEHSRAQVLRLVRALLLPNDHLAALLLQWLFAAVFIAIFTLSVARSGTFNLSAIGFYMVFLACARFAQVQRGLLLLRTSLTDLYLAAAPRDARSFHALIADALHWLVVVAVASAAVYAALAAWLLRAPEPAPFVVAVACATLIAALVALSLCLLTQNGSKPRPLMMTILTAFAGGIAFAICDTLTTRYGAPLGGGLSLLLGLPFALGFYANARQAALARPLMFDPPL